MSESKTILRRELSNFSKLDCFDNLIDDTDKICTHYRHFLNPKLEPLSLPFGSPEHERIEKQKQAFRLANERLSKEDIEKIETLKNALNASPKIISFLHADEVAIEQIKSCCELWLDAATRSKKQGVSCSITKSRSILRNELYVLLCSTYMKYVPDATIGCGEKSPFVHFVIACHTSQGTSIPSSTLKYRIYPAIERYTEAYKMDAETPTDRLFKAFFGAS